MSPLPGNPGKPAQVPPAPGAEEPLCCIRHPQRPTVLRCGKCGEPICVDCTIQTPVGARCRECAQLKPLPQFDVRPPQLARAALHGVFMAAGVGFLVFVFGGLVPFSSIIGPLLAGWAIGETVHRASNYKRGAQLRWLAVGLVALSALVGEAFFFSIGLGVPLARLVTSPGLLGLDAMRLLLYVLIGGYVATTRV